MPPKKSTPKAASTTLRDYFNKAKPKPVVRASTEIIVVDSDSDGDVEVVPKKRKLDHSSSVVHKPNKRVSLPPPPAHTFGKPTTLLLPEVSISCPPLASKSRANSMDDNECPSPTETVAFDEDWGAGDDEMGEEEDDATPILDDIEALVCPLCQLSLGPLPESDRQTHVNACLDANSAPAPKAGPSKLKPLSSLPFPRSCSNAFSVLMNKGKENAVWTEAEVAEAARATKKTRRPAPFYKVMEGMPIAVDAFRYGRIPGVTSYFLTHAHSDHYTNLSSTWKHGPIYCSQETADLIIHILSVDKKWVHPLPMDVPTLVPDSGGVHVTLISANHCPGSCLFLFEGPQTVHAGDSSFASPWIGSNKTFRYLHCGDFRASPQHTEHPAVKGKRLDHVYLDTTYLDPRYVFPPQPLVISACADLAKRIIDAEPPETSKMDQWVQKAPPTPDAKGKQKAKAERILMVVGTYSVGKERIVKAVAEGVNSKIYCDARKMGILRAQSDPELHALLTSDPRAADVHVLPLGKISVEKLQLYLEQFKGTFTRVVGFRPTGWTYSPPAGSIQTPTLSSVIVQSQQRSFTHAHLRPARTSTSSVQLYPVPYSEHSSFFELTCFALSPGLAKNDCDGERGEPKGAGEDGCVD
ncbi:DNA cross-link repair protein PSO2/SNM1 [Mycena kentingensis (nom. inval.)]|nr:DNA cross-link repair protein PSO2/SNM1 [Mycena kentingensis (nom. inval.)]